MARVWAARQHGQRGFQKLVAIKTILPHLAEEPEFERMFLDEARIASGVHHPNVCEIYELGEEKRTLYLAMEWVSGDSLSRVLRSSGKTEALDARVAARIIADACGGVNAAHELSDDDGRPLDVVHRDLSPHNILLTADGVAKVCDFGVAKALGQLHEQTSAGQLKGKISYMSPEQVTGAPIDRRSDVFSLGCVLYEATTGVRPFKGEHDHMIMHAILAGEVPPPTSIIRTYPPELERIVLRALAHQPILRYPTAERMRFALEEFLARGQLVTQSNVAQTVRARLGEQLERRKERIKQASTVAEGWDPTNAGSSRDAVDHRSGVKAARLTQSQPSSAHLSPVSRVLPPAPGSPAPLNSIPPPPMTPEGHGHVPNAPSIPPFAGTQPLPPMGQPPTTLLMSPLYPGGGGPAVHGDHSSPGRDWSSPGRDWSNPGRDWSSPGRDWSSPGHAPGPLNRPHTIPPVSGSGYGTPAIYDMPGPVPPETLEPPQAGAGQYALAALVGLFVAVLIGVGGFFIWHARTKPASLPPIATATASATTPAASASVATKASPPAPAEITFQVTPEDAVLTVDGKALGPGVRTIPRPATGETVAVVVTAKGFDDASLQVDLATPQPVVVALKPVLELDAPGGAATPEVPAASASAAGSAKPHPKPRPKEPAALPDNPY
jgi:eukaryotic-like serine/threonine-protein kinase